MKPVAKVKASDSRFMCASMTTSPSRSSTATAVTRPSGPNLTAARRASAAGVTAGVLTDMAFPFHDPAVGRQGFQAHGAGGVQLVGADPHLGAQAVFRPVREARGGVHHHGREIHAVEEGLLDL